MGTKGVVTGGSGFIGSHVVAALVEAGHDVTVVDHRVPPQRSDVGYEHTVQWFREKWGHPGLAGTERPRG